LARPLLLYNKIKNAKGKSKIMTQKERYIKKLKDFCAKNEWFESAPLNEVCDFLLVSIDEKRHLKIERQYPEDTWGILNVWDAPPFIQLLSGEHAGTLCFSSEQDNKISFQNYINYEEIWVEPGDLMLLLAPKWGEYRCINHGLSEFKLPRKKIALDMQSCQCLVGNSDLETIIRSEAFTTPVLTFSQDRREMLNTVYEHINFPIDFLLEQSPETKYIYPIYEALTSDENLTTYKILQGILDENSDYLKKYPESFPRNCPKCNKPIPFFNSFSFYCECSNIEFHDEKYRLFQKIEKYIRTLFYEEIASKEYRIYHKVKKCHFGKWIKDFSGGNRNTGYLILLGMGIFFRHLEDKYGSAIYSLKQGAKIDKVLTAVLPENADASEKEAYAIIAPFLAGIDVSGKKLFTKVVETVFKKTIPAFLASGLWDMRKAERDCGETVVGGVLARIYNVQYFRDWSAAKFDYVYPPLTVHTEVKCDVYHTDYIQNDVARLLFLFEMIFKKQQYEWGMPESGNFLINMTMPVTDAAPAELAAKLSQIPESAKVKLFAGVDGLAGKSFKGVRNILLNDYVIENISIYSNTIEFQLHKGKADNQQINCTIDKIFFRIEQEQLLTAEPDGFSPINLFGLNDRADEYEKIISQLEDCPFIELMPIEKFCPPLEHDYEDGVFGVALNTEPRFEITFWGSRLKSSPVHGKSINLNTEFPDHHITAINTPEFLLAFLKGVSALDETIKETYLPLRFKAMRIPVLRNRKWGRFLDKVYLDSDNEEAFDNFFDKIDKCYDNENDCYDNEKASEGKDIYMGKIWKFDTIQNVIDNLKALPVKEAERIEQICKKAKFSQAISGIEEFHEALEKIEKDKQEINALRQQEINLKSAKSNYDSTLNEFCKKSLTKFDLFIVNHKGLLDLIESDLTDIEKYQTLKQIEFKKILDKSWNEGQPNEISPKLQPLVDTLLKQYTDNVLSKANAIFKEDIPLVEKYRALAKLSVGWDDLSENVYRRLRQLLDHLKSKAGISDNDSESVINKKLLDATIKEMTAAQRKAQAAEHDRKLAQTEARVKEQVIADLSHHIKNLVRSVIDPLEILKQKNTGNETVIENALKGAGLIREIVNAMNLSFQGSHKDFIYDFAHAGSNSKKLEELLYSALRYAVMNMFSGKYFPNFVQSFFANESIYMQARKDWAGIPDNKIDELHDYLTEYFFDIKFDIDREAGLFPVGDDRGSAIKLLILFQEIVLNAVKYSAFVERKKRFVSIYLEKHDDKIIFNVINSFNPKKNIKSAGLGHVIIENFSKLLNSCPPIVNKDNGCYNLAIEFKVQ
jgi:signal transduction histidine kinase